MKVFLTGSTGYLGSAILEALRDRGHDVVAPRRPEFDLRQTQTYRDAFACDAIIHAAIESGPDRLDADRIAVDTLASPKLIHTSVMFVLGDVADGDESSPASGQRAEHERIVLGRGGAVIRPGMIWGGDAFLFAHPLYIDEGENRWPLVHREDVAQLYCLVAETNARGIFHAVTEVMKAKDVFPGNSVPLDEARKMLGGFADALALDQNVRAERSRAIGWRPAKNYPRIVAR
jgi:nucleoside-diphosphate-sugar epimerase